MLIWTFTVWKFRNFTKIFHCFITCCKCFYLQKLLKHLLFMYVMKTIGSVYNNNNNYYCSTNFMFIFAKKKEGACSLYMLSIVQRRKPPQPTLLALHCAILLLTRKGARKCWEGLHYRPANFNTPKKSYFWLFLA